jgi:hypothetical protein
LTVGGDPGGFDLESACAVTGSDEHRVLLRMPGRSGPATGRESTAEDNVPVPRSVEISAAPWRSLPSAVRWRDSTMTKPTLHRSDTVRSAQGLGRAHFDHR